MELFTYCSSCKKAIKIKSSAPSRPELARDKGDEFYVNCQNCGVNKKTHVNDVFARPNKIYTLIGLGVSFVVTAFLWNVLGAVGTISFGIPFIVWRQQASATNAFNRYRERRRQ